VWKETGSGAEDDRAERKKILVLAQAREIDLILITELTRWAVRCSISSTPCKTYNRGTSPSSHRLGYSSTCAARKESSFLRANS